jgi:hypothetical protein
VATRRIYKVIFHNQGEVFELFTEGVSHGNMFGFVELEGLQSRPKHLKGLSSCRPSVARVAV